MANHGANSRVARGSPTTVNRTVGFQMRAIDPRLSASWPSPAPTLAHQFQGTLADFVLPISHRKHDAASVPAPSLRCRSPPAPQGGGLPPPHPGQPPSPKLL